MLVTNEPDHASAQVLPLDVDFCREDQASFRLEQMHGSTVVVAGGEVDLFTSPCLHEALIAAAACSAHLIIDLQAVTFLDSTGLGVLAGAYTRVREQDGSISLVGPTGLVREVLHITRLDDALPVYASLGDAVAGKNGVPGAGG
jgi:anti-sigma B factor antagonist